MYTAGRRIMVLERARCAKRVGLTFSNCTACKATVPGFSRDLVPCSISRQQLSLQGGRLLQRRPACQTAN